MELTLHVCLGTMADSWGTKTDGYSFRFFSPEQVDQILRDGLRRGREGSHAAIERILKHEPGIQRAELWRRIRQLKSSMPAPKHRGAIWSPEDEKILVEGYEKGWCEKRKAISELLRRHPDWRSPVIWKRAAKLGLVRKTSQKPRQRSRQIWTDDDDRILLSMAGYKTTEFIGKALQRSENAVRYRLAVLGKSSRVHLEGYARRTLAQELHLGSRTIQRLIVQGLLEVRDPRITRKSLDSAYEMGRLTRPPDDQQPTTEEPALIPREDQPIGTTSANPIPSPPGDSPKPPRSCRAKRIWADLARQLDVEPGIIEHLIFLGVLKFYDPRVTEKSLTKLCARYGALIKTDFLDAETRAWLAGSMNLVPNAGKDEANGVEAFRKHARVVRTCEWCGRTIRGNVFFRHYKSCRQRNASRKRRSRESEPRRTD